MKRDRRLSLFFYDLATMGLLALAITVLFDLLTGSFDWRLAGASVLCATAYSVAGWRLGIRPGAYLRHLREPIWPPSER